jgi:hypothetical protein
MPKINNTYDERKQKLYERITPTFSTVLQLQKIRLEITVRPLHRLLKDNTNLF